MNQHLDVRSTHHYQQHATKESIVRLIERMEHKLDEALAKPITDKSKFFSLSQLVTLLYRR